jgi:hypothetical protein
LRERNSSRTGAIKIGNIFNGKRVGGRFETAEEVLEH